jgi:adenosylmethionine-8-amino-7-oxononanoate aminotransferase
VTLEVGRRGRQLLQYTTGDRHLGFVAGEGVELVTDDGARVIDAISGVGVTCLGYTVPSIAERMADQARTLPFAHAMRF